MQSFSQFGFKVEPYFTTTQLEYERLKTNLELVGHAAEKMPNGIGAILLGDDKHWLTIYKNNDTVLLGIYNSKTNAISRDIVLGYPKISEELCNAFVSRLELYSAQQLPMKHSKIESAWEIALQVNPPVQEIKQER